MNDLSMFDKFGGYYSVMIDGIEFSRHAPSQVWTASVLMYELHYGEAFSFRYVSTD